MDIFLDTTYLCQLVSTVYDYYSSQSALTSTHSLQLDDFGGAKFYCPEVH